MQEIDEDKNGMQGIEEDENDCLILQSYINQERSLFRGIFQNNSVSF